MKHTLSCLLQWGRRGSFLIPHPSKAGRGGEDAFFTYPHALCVADGVGGWAEVGVDPAIFTRQVVKQTLDWVRGVDQEKGVFNPVDVTKEVYDMARAVPARGTCTMAMCTVDRGTNHVLAFLVGDCGIMVVRDGKIIARSKEQQIDFNFPLQLADSKLSHIALDATSMAEGDVFVLGSDGLFDNVEDDVIASIAVDRLTKGGTADDAAAAVAEAAFARSKSSNATPFSRAAAQAGYRFDGGKSDDITVVVGVLTEDGVEQPHRTATLHEDYIFTNGRSVRRP